MAAAVEQRRRVAWIETKKVTAVKFKIGGIDMSRRVLRRVGISWVVVATWIHCGQNLACLSVRVRRCIFFAANQRS